MNNNYEEYEENDNIVTLTDEDGNETDMEFLDMVEYGGEKYGVFLPCDDEEEGAAVIMKLDSTEDDEADSFSDVDDENVLQAVFEIFKENNKDIIDFE